MLFRERQQIVIFCLAGAILGGFVLFRYLPLRERIKAVKSRFIETQFAIGQASARSGQLPALKKQLARLQSSAGNYEANIPVQRSLGAFLQQLTVLMNRHNLKEQLIAQGEEIEADELNCIPVSMQCRGRLAQVFEFYKSLRDLDILVRIEQVKLVNSSDFNGEISMQTRAIIYYRTLRVQG